MKSSWSYGLSVFGVSSSIVRHHGSGVPAQPKNHYKLVCPVPYVALGVVGSDGEVRSVDKSSTPPAAAVLILLLQELLLMLQSLSSLSSSSSSCFPVMILGWKWIIIQLYKRQ